jgi:hypothetical protein
MASDKNIFNYATYLNIIEIKENKVRNSRALDLFLVSLSPLYEPCNVKNRI